MKAHTYRLWILPALAFLMVVFVFPLLRLLQLSIFDPGPTLAHYEELIGSPIYATVFVRTFKLALLVAGTCLIVGYPVAFAASVVGPRLRALILFFVVLPHITSLLVRTYAWMILLGREGPINSALGLLDIGPLKLVHNTLGVYIGMVHYVLPLMIFPLYAAMKNIDFALMRAAASMGASAWRSFWRIYFPLSLPGVIAGTGLSFIVSLGFFVTPAILGNLEDATIAMVIDNQVGIALNWGLAAALAVVLLLVTMLTIAATVLTGRLVARGLGVSTVSLLGRG